MLNILVQIFPIHSQRELPLFSIQLQQLCRNVIFRRMTPVANLTDLHVVRLQKKKNIELGRDSSNNTKKKRRCCYFDEGGSTAYFLLQNNDSATLHFKNRKGNKGDFVTIAHFSQPIRELISSGRKCNIVKIKGKKKEPDICK